MINDIKYYAPQNVGWIESKLSKEVVDRLWFYIEKYKNNNSQLEENVSSSWWKLYDDDHWFYQNVLLPLLNVYSKTFHNLGNKVGITKYCKYILNSFWVNYQKQHEFNPLHDHDGIYSFVIWMKIPYDFREQHKLSTTPDIFKKTNPKASNFEFVFLNMLGEVDTFDYYLDETSEGTIILFPSKLRHQVYPFFNCDVERISISGNISLDTSYCSEES